MGQCSDGFLMNTKLLTILKNFMMKFVKYNKNMFLDDDLWLAKFLQKKKKSSIKNLINDFRKNLIKNLRIMKKF